MPILFGSYWKTHYFCTRFKREAQTQNAAGFHNDFSDKKIDKSFGGSI
jgi:hypothetical protein